MATAATKPLLAETPASNILDVTRLVNEGNARAKNGEVSLRSITLTQPSFLRGSLSSPENSEDIRVSDDLIGSWFAEVKRDHIIFSDTNVIHSTNNIRVRVPEDIQNTATTWVDYTKRTKYTLVSREEKLNARGAVVSSKPKGKKESLSDTSVKEPLFPGLQLGFAEFYIPSDSVLVGKMNYRGKNCLDIRSAQGDGQQVMRTIVYPEADYKVLYREVSFFSEGKTKKMEKYSVEKIKQVNGVWTPLQYRIERQNIYGDGTTGLQISRTWITDFNPNSLTGSSVFQPLLPPGIIVSDTIKSGPLKPPVKSVTGDTVGPILELLHKSDFSLVEEDLEDLS